MGEQAEESEEITVIEASYQIVTHRRQKYRCSCNAAVVTAPGPVKLTPGGRYAPEFAVHVAEAKYLDHSPLERQVKAMGRKGLAVDSQTLWDQLVALSANMGETRGCSDISVEGGGKRKHVAALRIPRFCPRPDGGAGGRA
jgi:transposase